VCRFLGRRDVVLSTRAAGRRRGAPPPATSCLGASPVASSATQKFLRKLTESRVPSRHGSYTPSTRKSSALQRLRPVTEAHLPWRRAGSTENRIMATASAPSPSPPASPPHHRLRRSAEASGQAPTASMLCFSVWQWHRTVDERFELFVRPVREFIDAFNLLDVEPA
jgi:hypothetical protein